MLNSIHSLPGVDLMTGALALLVFVAGAAAAVLAVLGVLAFRHAGQNGLSGLLWRAGLVLVGIVGAWVLLDRSSNREQAAERRAIETRASELTARAIAPGSALACLDAVASSVVESACEKVVFATPEAVAAAVAYVDARISLLGASIALAERDPSYQPSVERLRRSIEDDRFGLVAHTLMTRGCVASDCADLKLLRDAGRILGNMKAHTFETHIGTHSLAWNSSAAPASVIAAAPPSPSSLSPMMPSPSVTTGVAPPMPPLPAAAGKFDFPSAESIPPVSIMSAEPSAPPAAEAKPAPAAPPKRPPVRRPAARETAPPVAVAPPMQVTPPPAAASTGPQTSGSR